MDRPSVCGIGGSYLITDQHMDTSGSLFEDLIDLPRRDAEELGDLLSELSGSELFQVNGVVHCRHKQLEQTMYVVKFYAAQVQRRQHTM